MSKTPTIVIVPGWRDSGPGHWQSLWAEFIVSAVRVRLLVAPADPERRAPLVDFSPVPHHALPYRSVLVASSNDPYCPVRTAGAYARSWGSEFVRLLNAGHINLDAGFGEWPLGLALLQSLVGEPLKFKAPAPNTSSHSLELQAV